MARRKRHRRRKQNNDIFTFMSFMPRGRKAKKKFKKSVQAEKLNNGFEKAESTPFDKNSSVDKVVEDMQIRYNLTTDEKRFNTMMKKGFIDSLYEYNKIMAIYQSDVYVMLKELGYSDSYQIRDLVQSFDNNINSTDLEYALLSLIDTLKLQQTYNTAQIREAMDLGFSFDDAVYLTQDDVVSEITPENSLLELRDRLNALLETRSIRKQLTDELRRRNW